MTRSNSRAEFVRELAMLYPDDESVRRLLDFAGLPLGMVSMARRPMDTWFSAVSETDARGRRADLIKVVLLEHPENDTLHVLLNDALSSRLNVPTRAPTPTPNDNLERIMGKQSTLLPVSFLQRGLSLSRSVGRITTPEHVGTGFLISGDRLVTNHHVLPSRDVAVRSTLLLNFQHDMHGELLPSVSLCLRPNVFFDTCSEYDLTVVSVETGASKDWGQIPVAESVPEPQRVNIIQHPGGGPKQIALYHNVVSHIDSNVIQYYTDTMPGSSGSPLFDDEWRLVGLHHAGGSVYSPSEKRSVFRNEGIPLCRIVEQLNHEV
jgi:hypothetical protein